MLPAYGHHGLRFGRLPFAHRSHALGRLEFHRYPFRLEFQRLGQLLADGLTVILQLGPLQNHGGIHVDQDKSALPHQVARVPEKLEAIGVLPARIGIREMRPDVAQTRRSQQRIRNRVREYVRIRMSFEAKLRRHGDAAQDQGPPQCGPMHVPSQPGAELAHGCTRPAISSARKCRARSMSDGLVILMLRSLPSTTLTSTCSSRSTRLDSSVPVNPSSRALSKAFFSSSNRNTCGVCVRISLSRGSVARTLLRCTSFTVSTGTIPTIAAPLSAASANTRSSVSCSMNGRTASCTATSSVLSPRDASAFSTDC